MFSARFKTMMISFFCLFIVFVRTNVLYFSPLFQGPRGPTFPMRGLSMFWLSLCLMVLG